MIRIRPGVTGSPRRVAFVALAACFIAGAAHAQQTEKARDPWLWPFSVDSPWNTPIGSDAAFAAADSPMTVNVTEGGTEINSGQWSHPIYLAHADDPWVSVHDKENERDFLARIPLEARPDPKADAHMYVVEPAKHFVLEMYGTRRLTPGTIEAIRAFKVDLYGSGFHLTDGKYPGVRAMDASGMGGILRAWEIRQHQISHVLTFLLPPKWLKHGPVWPSSREDYWGFRDYKGNVPMGTLIAIPPSVDLRALDLSPSGLALAKALQDYGAYCADSSGSNGIIISAEGAAEGMPELADMRHDFDKIHGLLRPVTNNSAATPGGGGKPRRPPAPPLAIP